MSWLCRVKGRHDFPRRREWPLVSVTEVYGPGQVETFFAFKKVCRQCGAYEYEGSREVSDDDHAISSRVEETPIEIIRRDQKGVPYSSVTGQRVRYQGLGGN